MNQSFDIVKSQEEERKRIAEELHDTTVQDLVALSQQLEIVDHYMDKDLEQAKKELGSARKHIKQIIGDIRQVIYDLRPMSIDDIGWEAAVERLKEDITRKSDMNVIFDIDDITGIDSNIMLTIYRIMREAANNAWKHAQATQFLIVVAKSKDSILLQIKDDGIGIQKEESENHFGLRMIKEKVILLNGTMQMDSNESGTNIVVVVPI